jgi:hypothetical protein
MCGIVLQSISSSCGRTDQIRQASRSRDHDVRAIARQLEAEAAGTPSPLDLVIE